MKILVRLPNWLGDVVMSTAFLEVLFQHYPTAVVHLILKKELMDLGRLIPHPVALHPFSKQEFKGLTGAYQFGKSLRAEKFDLFFCLPDSLSSAVMGWATHAKKRIGYNKELRFFFFTHIYRRPRKLHRVAEYVALLENFTSRSFEDKKVKMVAPSVSKQEGQLVLINFNSEAPSRRMPVEKGREIIRHLLANFPELRFGFVGAPKEVPHVEALISGFSGNITNYAGKTGLQSLASLMASADFMISTDSGPAHLANSLSTSLLVLFGAGNELNTAPFNVTNLNIMRLGELPCEPCVKNHCKFGTPKCLELLNNDKIVQICKHYLN
jgi:lipopolysaccharide heptosyltransferase II